MKIGVHKTEAEKVGMLSLMRDENKGMYRGGGGVLSLSMAVVVWP